MVVQIPENVIHFALKKTDGEMIRNVLVSSSILSFDCNCDYGLCSCACAKEWLSSLDEGVLNCARADCKSLKVRSSCP